MSSEKFILDNGHTFLAVVQDLGATWCKATDTLTALGDFGEDHMSK